MCAPNHFDVIYDINPWMSDQIGKVNNFLAVQQWNNLLDELSKFTVVKVIDGVHLLPDLVFTANAGFIHNNTAVLSKFSKKERSPEEEHFRKWFLENGYTVFQPVNDYEGEGDHLTDMRGRHWVGSGFRTSELVKKELENVIGKSVNLLTLVDPRWYHLDTAFCPLPNGEVMWYPGAFSEESQQLIRASFENSIEINEEDALQFSCNCVCVRNHLFLPKNTKASCQLKNYGYEIHEFELSEFIKAGGAAKCLVLFCD